MKNSYHPAQPMNRHRKIPLQRVVAAGLWWHPRPASTHSTAIRTATGGSLEAGLASLAGTRPPHPVRACALGSLLFLALLPLLPRCSHYPRDETLEESRGNKKALAWRRRAQSLSSSAAMSSRETHNCRPLPHRLAGLTRCQSEARGWVSYNHRRNTAIEPFGGSPWWQPSQRARTQ